MSEEKSEEIDLDKFEWFDVKEEKNNSSKNKFISVSTKHSSNRIYINSVTVKSHLSHDTQYLRFGFYDNRYLIISESDKKDSSTLMAKSQGKNSHSSKIVTSHCLVNKIIDIAKQDDNTVKRYDVCWYEPKQVLTVDLKQ